MLMSILQCQSTWWLSTLIVKTSQNLGTTILSTVVPFSEVNNDLLLVSFVWRLSLSQRLHTVCYIGREGESSNPNYFDYEDTYRLSFECLPNHNTSLINKWRHSDMLWDQSQQQSSYQHKSMIILWWKSNRGAQGVFAWLSLVNLAITIIHHLLLDITNFDVILPPWVSI